MHEDRIAAGLFWYVMRRVQRIVQPPQVAWLVKNVEQRIETVSHLYRGCLALGSQFIAMPPRYEFTGRSGAAANGLSRCFAVMS
jgi:hypothetical protein